nr:MAG TPA: hypothetical protein [Caudoviricetes sp.]
MSSEFKDFYIIFIFYFCLCIGSNFSLPRY